MCGRSVPSDCSMMTLATKRGSSHHCCTKLVGRLDVDFEARRDVGWEVLDVVRDDDVRLREQGGRQHVGVLAHVRHGGDQVLEPGDAGVREGFIHRCHALAEQAWVQILTPPEDALDGFLENLHAPERAEDVVLSETKEDITQDLWVKDVGVQDGTIDQGSLFVDPQFLRLRRQPVDHRMP